MCACMCLDVCDVCALNVRVWLKLSCDQPQVITSEIVFGNGNCFVLYADMSRISFNNARRMCGY